MASNTNADIKFNYEAIVKECAIQDSLLEQTNKNRAEIEERYQQVQKRYAAVLEAFNQREEEHNRKILERTKLQHIRNEFDNMQKELNQKHAKIHVEIGALLITLQQQSDDFSKSYKQILNEFYNLPMEYDEGSILKKIEEYNHHISYLTVEIQKGETAYSVIKSSLFDEKPYADVVSNLKLLIKSDENSCDLKNYKKSLAKLATVEKNIDFLSEKCKELQSQLIDIN